MVIEKIQIAGYKYGSDQLNHSHAYLLPTVKKLLKILNTDKLDNNIFDLGCGNGSVANILSESGWKVTGIDPSTEGITKAKQSYPDLKLYQGSAYDDLQSIYGNFPTLVSLEVVEHVYAPRKYAKCIFDLLEPNGFGIISTPYHGYFKNLILALSGKMDAHFTALWDHGHIKFWSVKTLKELLEEAGFVDIKFIGVGRVPLLSKSMIVTFRKPE
jgi:2-polyprenyl-3-methyl-5-hydroxy-6-metoxy-1,4-benzoquinol methylase